jgi:glucan phosphoethanolaminetransferase (alkaline phosphatase superfamily)
LATQQNKFKINYLTINMIQRIQSIFLALIVVAMALVCSQNIWTKTATSTTDSVTMNAFAMNVTQNGTTSSQSTIVVLILAAIAGIMALVSLLQFKNRKLQMLLGAIISFIIAGAMGAIFYYIFKKGNPLFDAGLQGNYGIGFYAGGAALLFNMLSNRFIRRDENLVRSTDRLR